MGEENSWNRKLALQGREVGGQRFWDNKLILRVVWLGAVAAVIVVSLLPGSSPTLQALDKINLSDKVQHLAAYAALAFIPVLHERVRIVLWSTVFLLTVGVGLEFCQLGSEGRSFEVGDIIADCLGLLTGLLVGLLPRSRMQLRVEGEPGGR